jgi:hypothetical protein
MKQQFLIDTAENFQTFIWEDNQKIVPTSATLTVFKPGGSTELVSAQTMTVGGDGLLSYSLTTTHNDTADENYKAIISYIVSGTTYSATLFYDVVRSKLHKVITDEDIVAELPQLKNNGWRVNGTAESGSTTTIVDSNLNHHDDDYFTGGLAYSIDLDETRKITDFVGSTGTVTTEVFGTAISTDQYVLTRSYTKEIQRAFEKIEDLLVRAGRRPALVMDSYDLREVHIHYSVAEIVKGLVVEEGDTWSMFMNKYDALAYSMFKSLPLKYDESEDGVISEAEEKKRIERTLGRG